MLLVIECNSFNKEMKNNKKTKEEGGAIGGVKGGAIDVLTNRQKVVLKLIAGNTAITCIEIAETLSINESAVRKHITAIKKRFFKASRQYAVALGNQPRKGLLKFIFRKAFIPRSIMCNFPLPIFLH